MNESVKEPPAVFRLNPGEPDAERREQAAGVYVRHFYERMPWADAYFQVFPNLDVKRHSAETMACRLVAWLRNTYPLDIANQMEAHGLGTDDMLEKLRRQGEAKTRVKVGSEKENVYDDEGRVVKVIEKVNFEHDIDWRAHDAALGKQMAMHGHGAGASRRPLAESGRTLNDERQLLEKPEDMPRTIEEAIARGEPMTVIQHPEDLEDDEWQRQWAEYQKEREAEERARGPL